MPATYVDTLATNRRGERQASASMPSISVHGGELPGKGQMKRPLSEPHLNPSLEQQRLMIKAGVWVANREQKLTLLEESRRKEPPITLPASTGRFWYTRGCQP